MLTDVIGASLVTERSSNEVTAADTGPTTTRGSASRSEKLAAHTVLVEALWAAHPKIAARTNEKRGASLG